MSNTFAHQRTSTTRVQKGGKPRRLSKSQARELDRMSHTALAPIIAVVRADLERGL